MSFFYRNFARRSQAELPGGGHCVALQSSKKLSLNEEHSMTHLIVTTATEQELRPTESILTLKSDPCIVLSSVFKDMTER